MDVMVEETRAVKSSGRSSAWLLWVRIWKLFGSMVTWLVGSLVAWLAG